jgi:hypothetical protein
MLSAFGMAFKTPELRKKIFFTLSIMALFRFGSVVPTPGVSYANVKQCLATAETGGLFGLINLFSGGALIQLSVFALGIMPYITASIIVQLLTVVIPRFEALKKEGQSGTAKLTQYTRYLTIGLAVLQSTGLIAVARTPGRLISGCSHSNIPDTTGLTTNWGANFVGAVPFSQLVSVGAGTVTLSQPSEATGVGVPITFGQVNYPLPTDWLRQIEQTEWDRTNRWPLNGPKSAQEWQNFKSGIVYAGPRLRFRIAGNTIQLNPPPSAASLLSMEYVSKNWVTALAGTTKEKFTLDTDTPVFDESLMVEGLKLRWNKAKGFAYDEKAYNVLLSICQAQNKSAPTLSLAQGSSSVLLSTENIPDGNWPGS